MAQFCIIFVKSNIQAIDEYHMGYFNNTLRFIFYYPLVLNWQPLRLFCKKRCSLGFRKIHRKWAYFRVFFNEAVGLMARTFIEERLKRRSFPVRFSKIFFFFFFFCWCFLIIYFVINGCRRHLFKQATLVPYFL